MRSRDNLVVGLDIGTTKICAVVGERTEEGVEVVGMGTSPSKGMRKGVVINIDATVNAIRKAVSEAERMAGCEIGAVYAGIAGGHVRSLNSHGIVAIKEREVTEDDIVRVLEAAQAIAIPMDREIIHIIPQEYVVDDQDGIRDPRGMSGVRLAARVHIVTGSVSSAQNIVKCCHKTGLHVKELVLEQLASSEAVLSTDERELGVMLIDIGGGTTDVAVFCNGAVQHTAVLSLGGDHITRDIAIGLGTPTKEADTLKREHGCAMADLIEEDASLDIPGVGGRRSRSVSTRMLAEIIEPRIEEIFSLVNQELHRAGLDDMLPGGVVLTGGSVQLKGTVELAERVFGMSVRLGSPQGVGGLSQGVASPSTSTALGLMRFGLNKTRTEDPRYRLREETLYRRVRTRMEEWIAAIF